MVAKISFLFVATVLALFPVPSHAQETQAEPTAFAENVLLHVILHEIGHAVIREFDLPILGNEETMADAFATYYLVHYLPNRAFDVLNARVMNLTCLSPEVQGALLFLAHDDLGKPVRLHNLQSVAGNLERPKMKLVGISD